MNKLITLTILSFAWATAHSMNKAPSYHEQFNWAVEMATNGSALEAKKGLALMRKILPELWRERVAHDKRCPDGNPIGVHDPGHFLKLLFQHIKRIVNTTKKADEIFEYVNPQREAVVKVLREHGAADPDHCNNEDIQSLIEIIRKKRWFTLEKIITTFTPDRYESLEDYRFQKRGYWLSMHKIRNSLRWDIPAMSLHGTELNATDPNDPYLFYEFKSYLKKISTDPNEFDRHSYAGGSQPETIIRFRLEFYCNAMRWSQNKKRQSALNQALISVITTDKWSKETYQQQKLIELYLQLGANTNQKIHGQPLLHYVHHNDHLYHLHALLTKYSHINFDQALIDAIITPNYDNRNKNMRVAVITRYLQRGANPNQTIDDQSLLTHVLNKDSLHPLLRPLVSHGIGNESDIRHVLLPFAVGKGKVELVTACARRIPREKNSHLILAISPTCSETEYKAIKQLLDPPETNKCAIQ